MMTNSINPNVLPIEYMAAWERYDSLCRRSSLCDEALSCPSYYGYVEEYQDEEELDAVVAAGRAELEEEADDLRIEIHELGEIIKSYDPVDYFGVMTETMHPDKPVHAEYDYEHLRYDSFAARLAMLKSKSDCVSASGPYRFTDSLNLNFCAIVHRSIIRAKRKLEARRNSDDMLALDYDVSCRQGFLDAFERNDRRLSESLIKIASDLLEEEMTELGRRLARHDGFGKIYEQQLLLLDGDLDLIHQSLKNLTRAKQRELA